MDVRPEGTPAATFAVRAWTALQWARATPCGSRLFFAHLSLSLGAASRSFGSTSYDSRILFCSSRGSVNVKHADITNTSGQTRGLTSYSPYPLARIFSTTSLTTTVRNAYTSRHTASPGASLVPNNGGDVVRSLRSVSHRRDSARFSARARQGHRARQHGGGGRPPEDSKWVENGAAHGGAAGGARLLRGGAGRYAPFNDASH